MFTGEEWLVLVPISLDWGMLVPGFFFGIENAVMIPPHLESLYIG